MVPCGFMMVSALPCIYNDVITKIHSLDHKTVCFSSTHKYTILDKKQNVGKKINITKISKLHYKNNIPLISYPSQESVIIQQPMPDYNVSDYVKNNVLAAFVLYTILNECYINIMQYHSLLDCYHSNTSIDNFDIYKTKCILSDIQDDNLMLTEQKKYEDYDIFFKSCTDVLSEKNGHYIKMFELQHATFLKKIALSPK